LTVNPIPWIHPADLVAAGLIDAEDAAVPDG
jgi:hypothetical protein